MKRIIFAGLCALLLSGTLAQAQSSQGKGGATVTGDTADTTKGIGAPGASTTVDTAPAAAGATADPTSPNPVNPATGAPVPNAAISQPPATSAAPAGR